MSKKILFVGNSSIDSIGQDDGNHTEVIGGSAVNSAISASLVYRQGDVYLYSAVGEDFPIHLLEDLKINCDLVSTHNSPSNKFLINENTSTCVLEGGEYLPFNVGACETEFDHVHFSLRQGVPVDSIANGLRYTNYSIDVMSHSLHKNLDLLSRYFENARFVFMNESEYDKVQQLGLQNSGTIFVTNSSGVRVINQTCDIKFNNMGVNSSATTVGAGDTFLGAFLSSIYLSGLSLDKSVYCALAAASVSVEAAGVVHIQGKKDRINGLVEKITKINEQKITKTNPCYRQSLRW